MKWLILLGITILYFLVGPVFKTVLFLVLGYFAISHVTHKVGALTGSMSNLQNQRYESFI